VHLLQVTRGVFYDLEVGPLPQISLPRRGTTGSYGCDIALEYSKIYQRNVTYSTPVAIALGTVQLDMFVGISIVLAVIDLQVAIGHGD
jgi:hypothetical protein